MLKKVKFYSLFILDTILLKFIILNYYYLFSNKKYTKMLISLCS